MPLDFVTHPFIEKVGPAHGPGKAGFSFDGGRAVLPYFSKPESLLDNIKAILGSTEAHASDGGLVRKLPKAHPRYNWLYASRIETIQSLGYSDGTNRAELVDITTLPGPTLDAEPITDKYWRYLIDELTVEFTPRPYAVLSDNSIRQELEEVEYQDLDGDTHTVNVVPEWLRFTDYSVEIASEFVSASQGHMYFVRDDSKIKPGTGESLTAAAPHGNALSGFPKIYLSKSIIKFTWHQVPHRYVVSPDSYLFKYAGHVNQLDWYDEPAGSLLYMGFSARRYSPVVPEIVTWPGSASFSTKKFCDVELAFLKVDREAEEAPTPTEARWVAKGHNLHPWFGDRLYWYVVMPDQASPNDADRWKPTYESVPFQLLFADPDATLPTP